MKKPLQFSIIGFGNQARAWASNLKDSGHEVILILRENSSSKAEALNLGFKVATLNEKIQTDYCAILTPDHTHKEILNDLAKINLNLKIIYAHGYSVHSQKINELFPQFEHILFAPKAIASELRFRFENKQNLTAFYSLEFAKSTSIEFLISLGKEIGINNIYPASFKQETQADLFSEQTLLCSLIPYGILETYNTLIQAGYPKELAFYESFYESKLIIDSLLKFGPEKFFDLISSNALIGAEKGKKILFDTEFSQKFKSLLKDIENNSFENDIANTQLESLYKSTKNFWKNQNLTTTHSELRDSL